MATNETVTTEPVGESELVTLNRHTPIAPIDLHPDIDGAQQPADAEGPAEPTVKPAAEPQKNRHTPAEPAG
jgi:hypothetical protein